MSLVYLRAPTLQTSIPQEETKTEVKQKRRRHKCSKGELFISEVLKSLKLAYTKEYSLQSIPKLRFDFYIAPKILIEYDSKLHTQFVKYIHKTESKFLKAQQRDALKNAEAIQNDYLVIRIDESFLGQHNVVSDFIKTQIMNWNGKGLFCTLNPDLYEYLKNTIDSKIISKYKKKCT